MSRGWFAALIAAGLAACNPAPSRASVAPAASATDADDLWGSTVLIGVTYYSAGGEFSHQTQMYGVVEQVDPEGVLIRLQGPRDGEEFWLPPDLEAFQAAPPGDYRLRSTGEVLTDPDFTTTWTIEMPPDA